MGTAASTANCAGTPGASSRPPTGGSAPTPTTTSTAARRMSDFLAGECGDGLARLDDVGREHAAGLGTEIERVVRRARRNQEPLAGVQRECVPAVDSHLDRPGDDVADLLAGMLMPPGLDAGRDLGERLDDLAAGDRGGSVLDLCPLELSGEVVAGLRRRVHRAHAAAPSVAVCPRNAASSRLTSAAWVTGVRCGPPSTST